MEIFRAEIVEIEILVSFILVQSDNFLRDEPLQLFDWFRLMRQKFVGQASSEDDNIRGILVVDEVCDGVSFVCPLC